MKEIKNGKYKQVIVMRIDLKMSRGKIAVQACHASTECSDLVKKTNKKLWSEWKEYGAKKVILKVKTLSSLLTVYKKARKKLLPCILIQDKGLTEIPPSTTCLGIGPCENDVIDKITGKLPLLK